MRPGSPAAARTSAIVIPFLIARGFPLPPQPAAASARTSNSVTSAKRIGPQKRNPVSGDCQRSFRNTGPGEFPRPRGGAGASFERVAPLDLRRLCRACPVRRARGALDGGCFEHERGPRKEAPSSIRDRLGHGTSPAHLQRGRSQRQRLAPDLAQLGLRDRHRSRLDLDIQTERRLLPQTWSDRTSRFTHRPLYAAWATRLHRPSSESGGATWRTPYALVPLGRLEEHLRGVPVEALR